MSAAGLVGDWLHFPACPQSALQLLGLSGWWVMMYLSCRLQKLRVLVEECWWFRRSKVLSLGQH